MHISIIVAHASNRVIGHQNQLPWRMPADLKHFKATTWGHHVIMGRKTFESLPKLLPGRTTLVVTRQQDYNVPEGCQVAHSLEDALDIAKKAGETEAFIAGGGQLYQTALPVADRLYLTAVGATVQGDAFFPALDAAQWTITSKMAHEADEKNPFPYTFITLTRRKGTC